MTPKFTLLCSALALSACSGMSGGFIQELPESVAELAAPNQNLQAVTLREEDGCYWYQHVGPVETTLLPLKSKRGGHICSAEAATR